ncbi:OLD family protein [Streptomyces mirabilis]|uniref:hypothetical protein n=1 Tax=Streptomyces mirabilis TaxID=68239 RepID=UPI0036787750
MQHLVRVEAEQFRAFEEVALDLGRTGLILVTGPNNVGKSALLSILDALAGITPEGSQHYGRPSSITATWELTSGGRRRMLADVPDADNLFQGELATHLEVKFGDVLGKLQPVAVSVSAGEDWLELGHLDTATRMPSLQAPPGWSAASAVNPSDAAHATSTPARVSLTRRPGVRRSTSPTTSNPAWLSLDPPREF